MTIRLLVVTSLLALVSFPIAAEAQGVIRGTEQGAARGAAEGRRAAGPVGQAAGTVVGGVTGGVVGGVRGVLGINKPYKRHRHIKVRQRAR